jgi:LPXTG-motif cell wall-anchored protein
VKRTKKFSVRKVLAGSIASITAATIFFGAHPTLAAPPTATTTVDLVPLGTFNGSGGLAASEIVAFDSTSKQLFINNGALNRIDIVDIATPATPTLVRSVDMGLYGRGVQSVTVGNGIVAAAVDVAPVVSGDGRQTASNGLVVLMDTTGRILRTVGVGTLPDHVSFTPDKKTILVAGEGEPICSLENGSTTALEAKDSTLVSDANGTVSLIDVSNGAASATVTTLDFSSFDKTALLAEGVRVFFPGSTAAQDLEPEYITTNAAGTRAYVTLQEANAIAVVDLVNKSILDVVSLGYKDWGAAGLVIDTSDKDNQALTGASMNLQSYTGVPLKGMYMPDTIASMQKGGETFLLTANEGDDRDYTCFTEKYRLGDNSLATNWSTGTVSSLLNTNAKLARLNTTNAFPTKAAFDAIYTYGGRSFSIWNSSGALVWDSGSQIEEIIARDYPTAFNSDSSDAAASSLLMVQGQAARTDGRSDDKGPEPEALAVGTIGAQTFAFVGLERMGGIMVYDVSNPASPTYIRYKNAALEGLALTPANNTTPGSLDVSPEGMVFVPAALSPNNKPMLIVANELSGTTTMYEVRVENPIAAPTDAPAASTLTALVEKSITATTTGLAAGGSITATYSGFVPFESVQLIVASTPSVIATGTADATGSVTIAGNLPSGLTDGVHTLSLFAPVSGFGVKSIINIGAPATTTVPVATTTPATTPATVPAETLPATGTDSDQLPFALGLLALGFVLVGFKRRRAA